MYIVHNFVTTFAGTFLNFTIYIAFFVNFRGTFLKNVDEGEISRAI